MLRNLVEVQVGGLALLIALLHEFHLFQLVISVLEIFIRRHGRALIRRHLRHLLLLVHLRLTVDFFLAATSAIVAGRIIKVQDSTRGAARRVRVVVRVVHFAVREAHGRHWRFIVVPWTRVMLRGAALRGLRLMGRRRRRLHLLVEDVVVLRLSRLVIDVLPILVLELNVVIEINVFLSFDVVPDIIVRARVVIIALVTRFPGVSTIVLIPRPVLTASDRRAVI